MKTVLPLEVDNLDGLVALLVLIMVGPALVLLVIGLLLRRSNKKAAKIFYILAGIYLIVGLGICGGLMASF